MACGMRCRKASPSNPPDAKLKRTFKSDECSLAFCRGMKKRMRKGAALMTAVEAMACVHSSLVDSNPPENGARKFQPAACS